MESHSREIVEENPATEETQRKHRKELQATEETQPKHSKGLPATKETRPKHSKGFSAAEEAPKHSKSLSQRHEVGHTHGQGDRPEFSADWPQHYVGSQTHGFSEDPGEEELTSPWSRRAAANKVGREGRRHRPGKHPCSNARYRPQRPRTHQPYAHPTLDRDPGRRRQLPPGTGPRPQPQAAP